MTRNTPLCENMTSSTKPEVHNISQRRQRKAEPGPLATCIKRLITFGRVVFQLWDRTDGQTNILIAILSIDPGGEVLIAASPVLDIPALLLPVS